MQLRVLLCVGLVLCLPAMAFGTVTVSIPDHTGPVGSSFDIDISLSASAGEGLNSADIDVTMNDNDSTPPVPSFAVFSNSDILGGAGFIFSQSASTVQAGGITGPGVEIAKSVAVDSSTTNVPATGILIRLHVTFPNTPGSWVLRLDDNNGSLSPNNWFSTTGPVVIANINDEIGTLTAEAIVPEPSTIVLGLFAAAGLGAVVIRKRRAA
jgi:hypothetical protein